LDQEVLEVVEVELYLEEHREFLEYMQQVVEVVEVVKILETVLVATVVPESL
jgi:hypothetical protein